MVYLDIHRNNQKRGGGRGGGDRVEPNERKRKKLEKPGTKRQTEARHLML